MEFAPEEIDRPFPAGRYHAHLDPGSFADPERGFVRYPPPDQRPDGLVDGEPIPGEPWVLVADERNGEALEIAVLLSEAEIPSPTPVMNFDIVPPEAPSVVVHSLHDVSLALDLSISIIPYRLLEAMLDPTIYPTGFVFPRFTPLLPIFLSVFAIFLFLL